IARDSRALLVGMAGHDGGQRAGEGAAFIGIIGEAVAHHERTEVRVAEAERAEDVRVLRDFLRWITGVVDQDFLGRDVNAHGGLEAFDVEFAVFALELHEVQRREIARGVIDENVFAARVGGVNRLGAFARVPFMDGAVVLHAGIAADPRAFRDLVQERARVFLLQRLVGLHGTRPPFLAIYGWRRRIACRDRRRPTCLPRSCSRARSRLSSATACWSARHASTIPCHLWMAPSYCMPGSPQTHVPSAILFKSALASFFCNGLLVCTARVHHSLPSMDGAVVLHAGIAADPRAFRDLVQERARVFLLQRLVGLHGTRPPFLAIYGWRRRIACRDRRRPTCLPRSCSRARSRLSSATACWSARHASTIPCH